MRFRENPRWRAINDQVQKEAIERSMRRHRMPFGSCQYCDDNAKDNMMPWHDASKNCESGKHSHCTCDTCY